LVICDEIAAWRGEPGIKVYEVLKSAQGSRNQPLILNITTAGYESGGIYDELFKRGTQFLNGDSRESRFLPIIYSIDDELYWNDLNELKKSNPNLGVSVSKKYLLEEIAVAESSERRKTEFLTKYCNLKQNPVTSWLDFDVIASAGCDKTIEDFRGCDAVGGFDLSMTTDLTAACAVIEKGGIVYVICRFFMPETRFKKDRNSYQVNEAFIKHGILKISGENAVEYSDVVAFFDEMYEEYGLSFVKIGYDRYSARETVTKLKERFGKNNLDDVYQGWNLHPVLVRFEGLIKDGLVKFCSNELLKLHFRNVALYSDIKSGNRYQPVKIASSARIDGAMAVLCAMTMRSKYYDQFGEILKNEE
jgi:phage terminase large subunit-like protein